MDRGVVVGGLLICGSFLLAALLNHSAMQEVPEPAIAVPVNISTPEPAEPSRSGCVESRSGVDARKSTEHPEPKDAAACGRSNQ